MKPFETPLTGRPIHLTYFAPSGVYFGEAGYRTRHHDQSDIYLEVRRMRDEGRLPGCAGKGMGSSLILVDGLQVVPHLICPREGEGEWSIEAPAATPDPSLSPITTGLLATLALCLLYLFIRWGLLCP